MASVAICICTRDRPDDLASVLRSIAASSYPVGRVIVSDDGLDDRALAVCEEASVAVDYVRGPQRGLSANRNWAAGHVHEDLVLFLDDDCLLGLRFLDIALECMAHHDSTVSVGRTIVTGVESKHGSIVHPSAQTFLGFQSRPFKPGEAMTAVVINATLFPVKLFATHRFDENIWYGYEEVDLTSRAVAGGYRIVACPEAVNDHRPSPASRRDYADVVVASRLFVTMKRYAITERRYGRAAAFLLVAPAHAVISGLRRDGLRGGALAVRSVARAARYTVSHVTQGDVLGA